MVLYILFSQEFNRHYIGIADDVAKRLSKHNNGSVRSTKAYRPWLLLHVEVFQHKVEARTRELYLKNNGRARETLIQQLHMALSSNG